MKTVASITVSLLIIHTNSICLGKNNETLSWEKADSILQFIKPPQFREKVFNIKNFGAVGDGYTLNTNAIKDAVEACSKAGGGKVLVPEGNYFTGPIYLKSNVNLHLTENARLSFSTNPADYLPLVLTRWEGMGCYNYSPLIYAKNEENIAITGNGSLDGMANENSWWTWKGNRNYGWEESMPSQLIDKGRPLLMDYVKNNVPAEGRKFGEGGYLRPSFVQFYQCRNILVSGVEIKNAPFWVLHPVFSENITISGVRINSHGPNNDGGDPESCRNVLIEGCFFNTGDDCIAIKSGRNEDGRKWNIPSGNIIIRNCSMQDGHGGFVIGSEISVGCKNIFIEGCIMDSPDLDRAIRIKTNSNRGGIIEDIFSRNIKVGEVKEAVIKINCKYDIRSEGEGNFYPLVRNIYMDNITCNRAKYGLYFIGLEEKVCISDIYIKNCKFENVINENRVNNAERVNIDNLIINEKEVQSQYY